MISLKPAVLAVVLVLHTNAQKEDQKCDLNGARYCYWQLAWKYGANHLIRRDDVKTTFLEDICVTEDELPKVPICKQYYDSCDEGEKQQFTGQEIGYAMLQQAVTDSDTCADATILTTCISSNIENCPVFFYMTPTPSNTANNFKAAHTLRSCLRDALKTYCTECEMEFLVDYIDSIAEAVTYLYWDGPVPVPSTRPTFQTTLGTTTYEDVSSTHEASSTTSRTETPTEKASSTVTTEGAEDPCAENITTAKPEPTTPAPSSAFANMPAICTLGLVVLISIVWSA